MKRSIAATSGPDLADGNEEAVHALLDRVAAAGRVGGDHRPAHRHRLLRAARLTFPVRGKHIDAAARDPRRRHRRHARASRSRPRPPSLRLRFGVSPPGIGIEPAEQQEARLGMRARGRSAPRRHIRQCPSPAAVAPSAGRWADARAAAELLSRSRSTPLPSSCTTRRGSISPARDELGESSPFWKNTRRHALNASR